jgi:hypothetical protein
MLKFSTDDPFPLLTEDSHTYAEAQEHSREVDQWLGLNAEKIETQVKPAEGQQNWAGLGAQALMTPYTELRQILEKLKPGPGETIVDLGAAYGRMAFVIDRWHPEVRFVGYELEAARVADALKAFARAQLKMTKLHQADLNFAAFQPVAAEYYFIYDYGTRRAIEKTLADLRRISQAQKITVVGRGRSSRDTIERSQPWLSQVVSPEHFKHFSIYRSR